MEDLKAKTDAELAEWQAGWKETSKQWRLADIEWQRRLLRENAELAERISSRERTVSLVSAGLGATVAFAAVWIAKWIA